MPNVFYHVMVSAICTSQNLTYIMLQPFNLLGFVCQLDFCYLKQKDVLKMHWSL